MQRFDITVTVRMGKLKSTTVVELCKCKKFSIVVMHETEMIETMRRN